MHELILHHYPTSPFAEKARLMLGFKQLSWRSVMIPPVMPKPDLTALTGGYRKTPVLQIGADIYCDTALIARRLEAEKATPALYPEAQACNVATFAQWADSVVFQHAVSLVFAPSPWRCASPGCRRSSPRPSPRIAPPCFRGERPAACRWSRRPMSAGH